MKITSNPKQDNFNMPFEGEKHVGTIVMLPYREDTWAMGGEKAKKAFLDIVTAIAKYELVFLLVDEKVKYSIEEFKMPNVIIYHLNYNDSWARDNTLIFLTKDKKINAVDFRFNAWGGGFDGLYKDYLDDDALGQKLAKKLNVDTYYLDKFILEGGSIHTNGCGTFLVTEACLLSKGRNNTLSKSEIEDYLKTYLNAKKILWIPHGIVNDETNEHVDNMACFLDETTILLAYQKDESDLQHEYSNLALEALNGATTESDKPIKVIKCPLPETLYMTDIEASRIVSNKDAIKRLSNNRLAGSYVNFYQSDKFVLLPKFNVKEDIEAYNILHKFYPNKDIIQIESREILLAGGNIHCVTMQVPEGELNYED